MIHSLLKVCHSRYWVGCTLKEIFRIPKPREYLTNRVEDALIYRCYHVRMPIVNLYI